MRGRMIRVCPPHRPAENLYIEAAFEGYQLPKLPRAAGALQMPVPPLAPLLVEVRGEAYSLTRLSSASRMTMSLAFLRVLHNIGGLQVELLLNVLVLIPSSCDKFAALRLCEDVISNTSDDHQMMLSIFALLSQRSCILPRPPGRP